MMSSFINTVYLSLKNSCSIRNLFSIFLTSTASGLKRTTTGFNPIHILHNFSLLKRIVVPHNTWKDTVEKIQENYFKIYTFIIYRYKKSII